MSKMYSGITSCPAVQVFCELHDQKFRLLLNNVAFSYEGKSFICFHIVCCNFRDLCSEQWGV